MNVQKPLKQIKKKLAKIAQIESNHQSERVKDQRASDAAQLIQRKLRAIKSRNSTGGNRLKNYEKYDDAVPTRVEQLRRANFDSFAKTQDSYHSYTRGLYLYGLVHPDRAVRENIPVKLYSDVPIPTSSIGFHIQNQFTTSVNGSFLISWRPNFFSPLQDLGGSNAVSNTTYNNSSALNGTTLVGNNFFVDMGYYPSIALQRYRLVSAMMKVSYNGNVLNQAGTMLSCCTFDPFVCSAGNGANPVTANTDVLVDRFTQFSTIVNGLWNRELNVTKNSEGIECYYVPMDPDDYIFQRMGTYFGTIKPTIGNFGPDQEGAHIQYVLAGRNLPPSSNCVIVDWFYNFEVIASPDSAKLLKAGVDMAMSNDHHEETKKVIASIAKDGGFIKEARSSESTFGESLEKILKLGVKYLPLIMAAF